MAIKTLSFIYIRSQIIVNHHDAFLRAVSLERERARVGDAAHIMNLSLLTATPLVHRMIFFRSYPALRRYM